jgi:hypothetical protein
MQKAHRHSRTKSKENNPHQCRITRGIEMSDFYTDTMVKVTIAFFVLAVVVSIVIWLLDMICKPQQEHP